MTALKRCDNDGETENVVQEALRSSMETSVVPTFEICSISLTRSFQRAVASNARAIIILPTKTDRLAQQLIFGYTNNGDLRKYLCGFYDTKVGNKKETNSYIEIS